MHLVKRLASGVGALALLTGVAHGQTLPSPIFQGAVTNTQLRAMAATSTPISVFRDGFSTPGDGPRVAYTSSTSACSLNAGLGDGGVQVPTNNGGCWVATQPSGGWDARIWSAKCDGSTPDQAAINTALASLGTLGGGALLIPAGTCKYGAAIQQPANTRIHGAGHASSILAASVTNIDGIDVNGNDATIDGVEINCGAAGTNSAGKCVNVPTASKFLLQDFVINQPFIGVYLGTGAVETLLDGYISQMTASSGIGIEITGGDNQTFTNVLCQGTLGTVASPPQPRTCMDVFATGGLELFQFEALLGGAAGGVLYEPGTGQSVQAVWDFGGDYDSNQGPGINFAPTGTGVITDYHTFGQYASYSSIGMNISGSSGSTIQDVLLISPAGYINTADGIAVSSSGTVTGLTIKDATLCGNGTGAPGTTYSGVAIYSTVTHLNIEGSTLNNCDGYTGYSAYGVHSTQSTTNYLNIINNDLTGNNIAPASIALAASNATIMNLDHNLGIDDQIGGVASATTIAAPLNPQFSVTGTTAVQNITGLWNGRKFVINPTGAIAFGGGSVATSCTSTNGLPVLGFVVGAYAALKC